MLRDIPSRYSLNGIRTATTEPQQALLDRAVEVLHADDRILAASLAGSFATGEADPFSDVDLHCCVEDVAIDELRGDGWKEILHRITPTVMATTFPGGQTIGGYTLTPNWTHLDLVFYPRSAVDASRLEGVRRLFDKSGEILPAESIPRPPRQGAPYFPAEAVDFYFYLLGNLVTVIGRGELLLATNGTIAHL